MKLASPTSPVRRGFTLIEVLAAITIIGIMVFLAIPNITAVRRDAEENMAVTKASMLNVALSSYIQSVGIAEAKVQFLGIANGTSSDKNGMRYDKIKGYLTYSTANLSGFMPSGYTATLPDVLDPLTKTVVKRPDASVINY